MILRFDEHASAQCAGAFHALALVAATVQQQLGAHRHHPTD
jgi:hypothetical protein